MTNTKLILILIISILLCGTLLFLLYPIVYPDKPIDPTIHTEYKPPIPTVNLEIDENREQVPELEFDIEELMTEEQAIIDAIIKEGEK